MREAVLEIRGQRRVDGVERITLGKRVLGLLPMTVHAYRIGSTLIDAGPPNRADALLEMVGEGAIEHVVLTHHHEDHVGGAVQLAAHGATVHAPEASLAPLASPPDLEPYQYRVWGDPAPLEATPVGEVIDTPDVRLEVHPAPGHSPDHVVYHAPEEGWLFTGDAYLPPRETLRADEDLAGFLTSLKRLRALAPARIFPGHGSIVEDPDPAITGVLEHFRDLHEAAYKLRAAGHDATGVRRRMLGLEGPIRYYTGGHYAKQNLVDELLALERWPGAVGVGRAGGSPGGDR